MAVAAVEVEQAGTKCQNVMFSVLSGFRSRSALEIFEYRLFIVSGRFCYVRWDKWNYCPVVIC